MPSASYAQAVDFISSQKRFRALLPTTSSRPAAHFETGMYQSPVCSDVTSPTKGTAPGVTLDPQSIFFEHNIPPNQFVSHCSTSALVNLVPRPFEGGESVPVNLKSTFRQPSSLPINHAPRQVHVPRLSSAVPAPLSKMSNITSLSVNDPINNGSNCYRPSFLSTERETKLPKIISDRIVKKASTSRRTKRQGTHTPGRRTSPNSTLRCNVCNQLYSRKDNLRAHQRVHNGKKPYKCMECDAAFRWLGALRTHQATHKSKPSSEQSESMNESSVSKHKSSVNVSKTGEFTIGEVSEKRSENGPSRNDCSRSLQHRAEQNLGTLTRPEVRYMASLCTPTDSNRAGSDECPQRGVLVRNHDGMDTIGYNRNGTCDRTSDGGNEKMKDQWNGNTGRANNSGEGCNEMGNAYDDLLHWDKTEDFSMNDPFLAEMLTLPEISFDWIPAQTA